MTIAESLLPEFDHEMATTRRLLERVPSDKGTWKPHPKSFALGHLAQLLARMPGWMTAMLRDTEINLATSPGYSFEDALAARRVRQQRPRRPPGARGCQGRRLHGGVVAQAWRPCPHGPAPARCSAHAHQPSRPSSRAAQRVPPPERCAAPVDLRPDSR